MSSRCAASRTSYVDIVDWIIRITDGSGRTRTSATSTTPTAPGCRVYDGLGPAVRRRDGRRARRCRRSTPSPTPATIADDVIWAGNEDQGFATSHRAVNVGHHLGPWRWGAPTGRKIQMWVIANCVSEENEIFEEWVLHNQAARLAQCGVDVARRRAPIRQPGTQPADLGRARADRGRATEGGRIPVRAAEPSADPDDVDATRPRAVSQRLQPPRPECDRSALRRQRPLARRPAIARDTDAPTCARWRGA